MHPELNTIMPISANIYYHAYQPEEEGDSSTVILLHGAGGTHLHWPSQIRRLPGFRILAPDLPGHGKSEGRGEQSIRAYAHSVSAWLDAMQIQRAVVVGHSMGGAIALSLGLESPERVMGLGLVSTGARMPVAPQLLESASHATTFHTAIELIRKWAYSPNTPERLIELATRQMALTRPSVLHSDFLACSNFDLTDRLSEILQPCQVICGSQDQMTPIRLGQFLASCLPNASLEILPEAGHMLIIEQPQQTAALLGNFLSGLK
jgi:pimeloyl-ACP methyl ester carboxylesterase